LLYASNVHMFQAVNSAEVVVLDLDQTLWYTRQELGASPTRKQLDSSVKLFQVIDLSNIFVLHTNGMLWLLLKNGSIRELVDTGVRSFKAIDNTHVWVLDVNGVLWEEVVSASEAPMTKALVDSSVLSFQPLGVDAPIFVLRQDGTLWIERGTGVANAPSTYLMGNNITEFRATDDRNILVLRSDGQLRYERGPFPGIRGIRPPPTLIIDNGVA
jgi:hypothetical protein